MNVIPAIDLIEGQVVRLLAGQFEEKTVYDKDPVALARDYQASGFSELHIVDLDGARYGRQENGNVIRRIVSASTLDVQIGGGIRELSQLERWFDAGVTRVVIGSLAVVKPERV
ncbi:MAG: HisA/HisF-related TIM barrel protein, partial [Woeseiaceae bacterium]|nr:HisA/HisF-related TIM barrel protein [Woeseiaceae bacterium]